MFTLGADPEIFLEDAAGSLVSAIEKIGGSKDAPRPLVTLGDGFAIQEDNVAVEYNIPPAKTRDEFISSIHRTMQHITKMVEGMGLRLNKLSAAEFPIEELMHYKALEFGCDPDYNAWNRGRVNPRPRAASMTLRSCGGHVHVGEQFETKQDIINFVKLLDLALAVPSCLLDNGELRKQLYGKAGAFRWKNYGLEYRTLSNYWIFDPGITGWVYDNVAWALSRRDMKVDHDKDNILDAVNNNNKVTAQKLITKYNIPVYA